MDYKLELVLIPVTDVDRAKAFYSSRPASTWTSTTSAGDDFRVVQLTPPGSACSIAIGIGLTDAAPGSARALHLVVTDIEAARDELVGRGVEVSDVRHLAPEGWQPGPDPERADYGSFADFADPDGNTWVLQEVAVRRRDRRRDRSPPTRRASPPPPSGTGASCTSTATGCSPRSTRPRTRCRRRSCGRGAAGTASTAAPLSGRGSTASPPTSASTCSAGRSRQARRVALRSPRCRGSSPTPTGCSTRWRRPSEEPDAVAVDRETIELAFLAALQVLPPRQRAALIAARRARAGRPAETARAAGDERGRGQQRAAAGPGHACRSTCPHRRSEWSASRAERRGAGAARPLHRRPRAVRRRGRDRDRRRGHPRHDAARRRLASRGSPASRRCSSAPSAADRDGDWRLLPTRANRMPTAASYLRRPGDTEFRAFKLDVLRIEDGAIAEITTFGPALFPHFGLPATL